VITLRRIARALVGAAALCAVSLASGGASADDVGDVEAEVREIRDKANGLSSQYLRAGGLRSEHYVEERLIDGENFYRLKDYQRAAIIFMDLIEQFPSHAAYPDALYYFADALFLSRDYYGARQWFQRVVDEGGRPGMARFRLKAIGRLIEIAVHLNEFEGVDTYLAQLGQTDTAETCYVKGKFYYFKGDLDIARQEFGRVKGNAELELKAAYFIGTILTKQGRFVDAIGAFQAGASRVPSTPAEQEVVDLLNLGLGRLYFEKEMLQTAAKAYRLVDEYSPYFDTALYEQASVKIRTGDATAAEQLLEVLTLAVPDSRYLPKAKLLRGNLLLHEGRYDDAERVFEETINEFTPVRDQLDQVMAEQRDTRQFFTALMERSLTTTDISAALPPLIVKWVGEEPEVQRALTLTADLGVAREYTLETERLLRLIEAVIDGPSRVNAIPTIRSALRRSQQMSNRRGQLRVVLLDIAQRKFGAGDAELRALAAQRKALQSQLDALPTSDEEFQRREEKARAVYQHMRQELARNEIRLDRLVATVVALERFISDPAYTDGVPAQNITALQEELNRHRSGVDEMRKELKKLREDIESARYQIGVGDNLDRADDQLREKVRQICAKERALLGSRGGQAGQRIDKTLGKIEATEESIAAFRVAADKEADRQIEEIRRQVLAEREHVKQYRAEFTALNEEAEEVVGGVTFENFSNVRVRFHNLILKADVGVIDVAWMRKEEHRERGSSYNKQRLMEIQNLDQQFEEVKSGDAAP
jgi:tetratricopeptide (TPR) repeat protein